MLDFKDDSGTMQVRMLVRSTSLAAVPYRTMHRFCLLVSSLCVIFRTAHGSIIPVNNDLATYVNGTSPANISSSYNDLEYDCKPLPWFGYEPLSFHLCRSAIEDFRLEFETESILMSKDKKTDYSVGHMHCPYSTAAAGCTFTLNYKRTPLMNNLRVNRDRLAEIGQRLTRACVRGGKGDNPDWGFAVETGPGPLGDRWAITYTVEHTRINEDSTAQSANAITTGLVSLPVDVE